MMRLKASADAFCQARVCCSMDIHQSERIYENDSQIKNGFEQA